MKINKSAILSALKADLKSAEMLKREQDAKIAKWNSEYEGKPYGNETKGKSAIVSRDIKKQSEWQHATIVDPFVSTSDIIKAIPITFEDEAADMMIRVMDLASYLGIDLDAHVKAKMRYNSLRPIKHGKKY